MNLYSRIVLKKEDMLKAIKIESLPSYQKGEIKGIEKGRIEGIEKEKLHIALNMLKAGVTIKDVALFTELNFEEVEEVEKLKIFKMILKLQYEILKI